jgi:hypothetical protein
MLKTTLRDRTDSVFEQLAALGYMLSAFLAERRYQ